MKLQDIFVKPVDRNIEGVIKADDESQLKSEVEEYVITNEVAQRLELFFEAYNDYQGKNGSWISGFFGSGKSHLLKMLAFILENREIDGTPIVDVFMSKCEDNKLLAGGLKKAAGIPSQSILFNIDQKADVISKKEIDALLAVFVKVFNESCGYYGKLGHVAQFERDLVKRGLYDDFKKAYREIAEKDWLDGREETALEKKNISWAYAKATGNSADETTDIIGNYRADYAMSIEDFAGMINEYIQSRGKDFRLNFFVDEVGQYIADNVKLMTNLQTIAESLATKCKGRSWIIVTAQEDMKNVVGELGKQQSNDFSKIQARFDARMKLSSQNVDEVIQKRLLKKNDAGTDILHEIYRKEHNNFKTLFDFSDGATTYRNFRDSDHFVNSYPFIPYQFDLFQAAITNLSQHNAFEGKHSSVGERSMLGVFQEVAKKLAGVDVGCLATFDLMFEGIRTTLKSQIQSAIILAEKNLENPLAVKVLKALLLVKYIKGFNATVRNVTVLMQDAFDSDLTKLRKDIEETLNILEQQTYVKRDGDLYEYLTDEEKDVEAEIKDTDVEIAGLITFLGDYIYEAIIRDRKIRYAETGQDYNFTRRLDDRLFGKEFELGIQVITPFYSDAENPEQLRAKNMGSSELMVILPPDSRLVMDVRMFLKTKKYIDLNITTSQKESVRRILENKRYQNDNRREDIERRLRDLLGKSKLLINGDDIEVKSEDPKLRVTTAFQELVKRTYPNLKMLRGVNYSEGQLKGLLSPDESMFKGQAADLSEAEQEVLITIRNTEQSGNRTTIKTLVDKFERRPYGWNLIAILAQIAKLFGREAIDAKEASNILTADDLESALLNTHGHQKVYLDPVKGTDPKVLKQVRDFYSAYFDRPAAGSEKKTLGTELSETLNERYNELEKQRVQADRFPFLNQLDEPLQRLKAHKGKPYSYYFEAFPGVTAELIKDKENILDSIMSFMSGKQKDIYLNARSLLDHERDNLSFVDGDDVPELCRLIDDPECCRNNTMPKIKSITEKLDKKIRDAREKERTAALKQLDNLKARLIGVPAFSKAPKEIKSEIDNTVDEACQAVNATPSIAMIRNRVNSFENNDYAYLLGKISITEPGKTEKPVIPVRSLAVDTAITMIETEADVDAYLAELKAVLLKAIKKNRLSI